MPLKIIDDEDRGVRRGRVESRAIKGVLARRRVGEVEQDGVVEAWTRAGWEKMGEEAR